MSRISLEIKKGIKAHIIKTNLYKTNLICITITVPLIRSSVTKNALIPFLLRRGSGKYENQYIINKELENMYGATFDCGIDKMGDNQIFKFYLDTINNEYALNNENILKEAIDLILDITFNPVRENGLFKQEFLNIEKENLRKVIESKIDNKDLYALDRCIFNMYGENGFGLYKYGYIEDIDSINVQELTEHYDMLIQNSKIDIFLSGKFEVEDIKEIIINNENIINLKPRKDNYILNNESTESKQKVEKIKEIQEKMNINQGKLIMGLDVLEKMDNLQSIALVYNSILGDGANSMLFQNVREKASLAYTARSNYVKQKLNIFIRCGIQIENYEKAVSIIKEQLNNIKNGDFFDEDIKNAKMYLISGIKSVEEEQDTEIVYYIGQEISETNIEPEEYIKKIESVNREEIINLAKNIEINTIYFLRD